MTTDERRWLRDQQPPIAFSDDASRERARAALAAHIAIGGNPRGRLRGPRPIAHLARRRTLVLASTGALAAAATAVAILGGFGHASSGRAHLTIVTAPATRTRAKISHRARSVARTPLVRLAADVRLMHPRAQTGDATLVVRYTVINGHHEVDGAVYGGYDLYTDAGRYYYAPFSLVQLQQSYDRHRVSIGSGDEAKALRTIAAAADDTPAQARAAVLRSLPPQASRAQIRRQLSTVPEPYRRRFLHLLNHATKAQRRASQDSQVYDAATQALEVGAGRPDVRAASINALSTLRNVTEKRVRLDGVDALRVDFPDGGPPEIIWLDGRTGVPIQEKDGTTSATAFEVKRVDAAHLPTRLSPAQRLQ